MARLTALMGWETQVDLEIIDLVENNFQQPLVFFCSIQQPTKEMDGYWHIRVKGVKGVMFIRRNGMGDTICYGPTTGFHIDNIKGE